jgi:hypothetical protein
LTQGGRQLVTTACVASIVLVVVYLALGGSSYTPAATADPCQPRSEPAASGIDGIAQQLTLSALDGAACELHVSRETLVLALGTQEGRDAFTSDPRLAEALRAGLLRAIDDAGENGTIPGPVAAGLHTVVENLPADQLVAAARNAGTLLGDASGAFGAIQGFLNGL